MEINHIEDLDLPEEKFDAGEIILKEGVQSSKIYVLQTGKVRVLSENEELCVVDVKGAVFGDVSVLLDKETSARVEVIENSTFLVIEDAANFLKTQPELIFGIAQILASRLVHMNHVFVDMKYDEQNSTTNKIVSKLNSWMLATNHFFDRDILHPFHKSPSEIEDQKKEEHEEAS